ncbi:hypothetical protein FA95DRAFT_1678311 [Auriscalpium vulgare]|uniref:Uncharacterized protein n=1 Tax=Auriscalpium vulgare TaxID=40419 RepID=A0ACB8RW50_9AGAM|nr:hypothetical protein FA95DRAFT_1678311 [Auriscalpium vulgare]
MGILLAQEDAFGFKKLVKTIGRAYQKRALELIRLCRLLAHISDGGEGQLKKSDGLTRVLGLVSAAMEAGGKAGKGTTSAADGAFSQAVNALHAYMDEFYKGYTQLGDARKALDDATQKDGSSMTLSSRVATRLGPKPGSLLGGKVVRVNFCLLKSPTGGREEAIIVSQELDTKATLAEVLWMFNRFRDERRIALDQNAHFYTGLPDNPAAYTHNFRVEALQDIKPGQISTVYVLVDRPSRIIVDLGNLSRTFGNIWKPGEVVILKDLKGSLEAADLFGHHIQDTPATFWRRGDPGRSEIAKDWKTLLHQALKFEHIDWLIRTDLSPEELPEEWVPCSPVKEKSQPSGSVSTQERRGRTKRPRLSKQAQGSSSTTTVESSRTVESHKAQSSLIREHKSSTVSASSSVSFPRPPGSPASPMVDPSSQAQMIQGGVKPRPEPIDSGVMMSDADSARNIQSFAAASRRTRHSIASVHGASGATPPDAPSTSKPPSLAKRHTNSPSATVPAPGISSPHNVPGGPFREAPKSVKPPVDLQRGEATPVMAIRGAPASSVGAKSSGAESSYVPRGKAILGSAVGGQAAAENPPKQKPIATSPASTPPPREASQPAAHAARASPTPSTPVPSVSSHTQSRLSQSAAEGSPGYVTILPKTQAPLHNPTPPPRSRSPAQFPSMPSSSSHSLPMKPPIPTFSLPPQTPPTPPPAKKGWLRRHVLDPLKKSVLGT